MPLISSVELHGMSSYFRRSPISYLRVPAVVMEAALLSPRYWKSTSQSQEISVPSWDVSLIWIIISFRIRILQHQRHLLLEADRVLRQMKLNLRAFNTKNTFSVISVIKRFDHCLKRLISRSHGLKGGISGKGIIYIVGSPCGGINMLSVQIKGIQAILPHRRCSSAE